MRAQEIMSDQGVAGLALNEHPDPTPGPGLDSYARIVAELSGLIDHRQCRRSGPHSTDGAELRRRRRSGGSGSGRCRP
jgi:hypothetical protein